MVISTVDYWVPLVWGLIMLAGWLGWGELARWSLGIKRQRVDWGLLAGWGMAAMLIVGGFLQVARLCNQTLLTIMALAGAGGWGLVLYARMRDPRSRRRLAVHWMTRRWLHLGPAIGLLIFFFATSIQTLDVNWWDDLPAYLVMTKRLAQTGIILDPFSVRRILTFGGQQMFDAMLLAGGTIFNIDILEMGLSKIVFGGLVIGMLRGAGAGSASPASRWKRIGAGALLFILLMVPVPYVNIHSEMTGVILFLTLLRTLQLPALRAFPLRRAAAAGLVGAAAATMRMNFVPGALLAIGLTYWMRSAGMALRHINWKAMIQPLCLAGAAFGCALLPWSIVLHQSSNSYLYPLMRGTQRPDYDYLNSNLGLQGTLEHVGGILAHWQMIALLVPLVWALQRRFWRTELPFYLAAMATSLLTLFTYTLTEFGNLYRFLFPALFAVAAAVFFKSLIRAHRAWEFAGISLMVVLLVAANGKAIGEMASQRLAVWKVPRFSPLVSVVASEPEYHAAQVAVPPDQAILVAVSFPSLLDYSRNTIYPVDMIGGASPDPGMPIFQGGSAVKGYLKKLGIDYVIYVSPSVDRTHMSRQKWIEGATDRDPAFRRVYKFNLAFMDDIEELGRTEETLYADRSLRVIHLK